MGSSSKCGAAPSSLISPPAPPSLSSLFNNTPSSGQVKLLSVPMVGPRNFCSRIGNINSSLLKPSRIAAYINPKDQPNSSLFVPKTSTMPSGVDSLLNQQALTMSDSSKSSTSTSSPIPPPDSQSLNVGFQIALNDRQLKCAPVPMIRSRDYSRENSNTNSPFRVCNTLNGNSNSTFTS